MPYVVLESSLSPPNFELKLCSQRATIEFVHLQRIDFDAGFCCPNGARFLTADGIRFVPRLVLPDRCCSSIAVFLAHNFRSYSGPAAVVVSIVQSLCRSVGFKAAKARVDRPWIAPEGAEAVAGSLFCDRVMVPDAKARELLHRFSKPAEGEKHLGRCHLKAVCLLGFHHFRSPRL